MVLWPWSPGSTQLGKACCRLGCGPSTCSAWGTLLCLSSRHGPTPAPFPDPWLPPLAFPDPLLGDFEVLSYHPPQAGLNPPCSEGPGGTGAPEAAWGGSQVPGASPACQSAAELTSSPWAQAEDSASSKHTESTELTCLTSLVGQTTPSPHGREGGSLLMLLSTPSPPPQGNCRPG